MTEVTTEAQGVERIERAFWRRYDNHPTLQHKLRGKSRVIHLDVQDGQHYVFRLVDGRLQPPEPGRPPDGTADITVHVHKKDFLDLFNGHLKPMAAYTSGRIRVRCSLADKLFALSLLGATK